MKKTYLFPLVVFTVLFFAFMSGCGENNETSGPSGPTATPTALPGNFTVDDFEDGNKYNEFDNLWTAAGDSADSGNTTIDAFDIINGGAAGTNFCAGVTATVHADISSCSSPYCTAAAYYNGYFTLESEINSGGADLTSSTNLVFNKTATNTSQMSYRVFIYGADGKYCYDTFNAGTSWTSYTADLTSAFTTGGAYTVNDVISQAAKIVFLARYSYTPGSSQQTYLEIDQVRFDAD